ncbi:MAG: pilus assembly protein PilP [Polyangiaceae bacterium]
MKTAIHLGFGALLFGLVACGGQDKPPPPPSNSPAADAPPPKAPTKKKGKKDDGTIEGEPADLPPLPVPDIQERDFLESPTNRDPFQDYADVFSTKPVEVRQNNIQRDVLVAKYALEELKIVGIVLGGGARVLVTDPTGLGWVLRVGDFVGKAETIRAGGAGGGVAVNWRLDRIRENDVVFVRETPDASAPAATRVLSMRTQDELKQEIRTGIRGTRPDEEKSAEPPGAPIRKDG